MRGNNTLSDNELKNYAEEHIQYEVDMLCSSAGILAFIAGQTPEGYLPWTINNGLLNSFSLHARNLINFLYSKSRGADHSTDIIIEDYIDTDQHPDYLPDISPFLEEVITKSNKQAAHLTMERIEYEESGKEWMFLKISKQIMEVFRQVANYIPDEKISEGFRNKLLEEDFKIPKVFIQTKKNTSGVYVSVKFSINVLPDGKSIEGVTA